MNISKIQPVGLIVAVMLSVGSSPTTAQPVTYLVDNTHSSIQFAVTFMSLTEVSGRFDRFCGSFVLNEADMPKSRILLFIDASSVNTGLDIRDGDLRNDYFEVKKFPIIAFKSKSILKSGAKRFEVKGDLALHGVVKEMTLLLDILGSVNGVDGKEMGLKSKPFSLARKDFNISLGNTVGDTVTATALIRVRTFYKARENFHNQFPAASGALSFPFDGIYADDKSNAQITLTSYAENFFIAFADKDWRWFNRVYQIGDNRFKLESFSHTFELTQTGLRYMNLDEKEAKIFTRK
ncbi:YceI family protein [Chryseolinea soli]|uniref:YceI family protein n=1 Tax=Chryseolinea soli TaxID=2321403 RepID=A0A385SPP4_9BACT|nr:YceI family protein [Chryseolinea soli]AYB33723.1 YceI family protein [Chryseolinea soli]